MKIVVLFLFFITCFGASASKANRSLASFSTAEIAEEKALVGKRVNEYLFEELMGSRAGFAGAKPWSNFILNEENPGWDAIDITNNFRLSIGELSEDVSTCEAKVTFLQKGRLYASGKFQANEKEEMVDIKMVLVNGQWMIQDFPEDLPPQVSRDAAMKQLKTFLTKAPQTNSAKYQQEALKALKKIRP